MPLEQLSADLLEQQGDFLSASLPSLEQFEADLPAQQEDLPSFAADFASFEEVLASAFVFAEVAEPPSATFLVVASAPDLVEAT